ncbi:MAG: 3-deoxy-manno-octulosonate cytidylyltransferase [Endomicrobiia bacterium]
MNKKNNNRKFVKVLAVIPARYNSKRLPGKPLALIEGKPMIQWVYENVKKCELIDKVVVATDDKRIYDIVKNFGGEVMMTSRHHKSGSDRVAEVARRIPCNIVLNVQGDEPMISPEILKKIILEFKKEPKLNVVTPICRISYFSELFNINFVKVVTDKKGYALYFSRSVIPFIRDKFKTDNLKFYLDIKQDLLKNYRFYRHIGVYGFKRNFLFKFLDMPVGKLEMLEKLEQLRILEYGYKIKTVLVNENPFPVDTPEDLKKIRKIFKNTI